MTSYMLIVTLITGNILTVDVGTKKNCETVANAIKFKAEYECVKLDIGEI
jgi:hypothetical protein